jgi:hypothetical protein
VVVEDFCLLVQLVALREGHQRQGERECNHQAEAEEQLEYNSHMFYLHGFPPPVLEIM